jgi:hypothetical protein
MVQQLDQTDLVPMEELIVSNTIQLETMYQLLIEKEYFTEAEFLLKMKDLQVDYHRKSSDLH